MTGPELAHLERRLTRPYDEQDPSTLVLPNDTLLCSYDRAFLGAAGRAVLDAYHYAIFEPDDA